METVMPASSASHSQTDWKLWPSSRAARISGQRAQIWPALVSGFFARRCARRFRVSGIQSSANDAPHIPREWGGGFGTPNRKNIFVGETIGDGWKRARRIATVLKGRDNPRQL